ncbi:hypothetical protein CPB84DRAFT_243849 [Gymnopilus junonius]|uniref:Uncharacterized protein n=1 Tax=Gymnopilus junonius TaxID=109634 RepID=A0A9P5NY73_GYMJU|nr:hypothetical protein CPB84DRAFT_243849 [Gymnopilus junonius]
MNAFEFAINTPPSYTNPFWREEGACHNQSIPNVLHFPQARASWPNSSTIEDPLPFSLSQIHAAQQHMAVLNQPPRHSILLHREDLESAYGPSRPESHRTTSRPNPNTNYDNHTNRLNESPSPPIIHPSLMPIYQSSKLNGSFGRENQPIRKAMYEQVNNAALTWQ